MKANSPSLILYFAICALVVIFKILEYNVLMIYVKSVIVPVIFMYYLITNHYKIEWIKAVIFLFCFIGDVFNLLNFNDSGLGALLSFLIVYLLLLKLAVNNFRHLKFNKKDSLSLVILFLFIVTIGTSILTLSFEKMELDFSLYLFYGIILSLLSFVSIANYIKKGNYCFFNLVFMCVCFMISDATYVINKFYFNLYTFSFINIYVQIFSYIFMVTYFIEDDKYQQRIKNV